MDDNKFAFRSFPFSHTTLFTFRLFASLRHFSFHPWPTLESPPFFFSCSHSFILSFLSGFFKGTSADQDRRFSDKELKLLKTIKFPSQFDTKVSFRALSLLLYTL